MTLTKTLMLDFIDFLDANYIGSVRTLNALKARYKNSWNTPSDSLVEDITDKELLEIRNFGNKSLTEYKELIEKYLHYVAKAINQGQYCCPLPFDVIATLNTLANEQKFVETAILEKLQRDNIPLVKVEP
jgi:hypothetical protein